MDYLAEHRIGIESCLTSNVQTSTVASLAQHPLKQFLEHGVLASLNTDDPAVQGVDIIHEYTVAAPAAGLSREQIRQAQINGLTWRSSANRKKPPSFSGLPKADNRPGSRAAGLLLRPG